MSNQISITVLSKSSFAVAVAVCNHLQNAFGTRCNFSVRSFENDLHHVLCVTSDLDFLEDDSVLHFTAGFYFSYETFSKRFSAIDLEYLKLALDAFETSLLEKWSIGSIDDDFKSSFKSNIAALRNKIFDG